ncbi:MAG: ribose 5-phosphate isomerase B [Bacteroidota bacterium]
MKIAIGNDHAGTTYKVAIVDFLSSKGIEVVNYGTDDTTSVDYPDFVHPVATDVETGKVSLGIVVCGSGNGASMTINKHQGIRGALCWNKELVVLARSHNNANILSLPARFIAIPQALDMVQAFLETEFDGGRHEQRIKKIPCSEIC